MWVLNLYYLESGAEGIEPVASMFVSDFVADEPDGPEMIMYMVFTYTEWVGVSLWLANGEYLWSL